MAKLHSIQAYHFGQMQYLARNIKHYTLPPCWNVDQKMWKKVHLHNSIWNESTSRYSDWR